MSVFTVIGGVCGLLGAWWLYRRWRYADDQRPVSATWRRQQHQLGDRVEFHGPRWGKINKVVDEAGWFNRRKYRKGGEA